MFKMSYCLICGISNQFESYQKEICLKCVKKFGNHCKQCRKFMNSDDKSTIKDHICTDCVQKCLSCHRIEIKYKRFSTPFHKEYCDDCYYKKCPTCYRTSLGKFKQCYNNHTGCEKCVTKCTVEGCEVYHCCKCKHHHNCPSCNKSVVSGLQDLFKECKICRKETCLECRKQTRCFKCQENKHHFYFFPIYCNKCPEIHVIEGYSIRLCCECNDIYDILDIPTKKISHRYKNLVKQCQKCKEYYCPLAGRCGFCISCLNKDISEIENKIIFLTSRLNYLNSQRDIFTFYKTIK